MVGPTFLSVCLLYATTLLAGFILATRGRLDVVELARNQRTLSDPLTRRFQQWLQPQKMNAIRQKRWPRLCLLIFLNNFGAVAIIGRTLYSMAIVPAAYFTFRQGLSHGAAFAHPLTRPRGMFLAVLMLEFGAYLTATAAGLNFVISLVAGAAFADALRSLLRMSAIVAAALLVGAWLEVCALRTRMPDGFTLPQDLDREELRAKALELMARQLKGNDG
jgi:hypothetical protein